MMPQIPAQLSVDGLFALHLEMAHHDPDHRKNTRAELGGREPTDEQLVSKWFRDGAEGFERTVAGIVRARAHA